MWNSFLQLSEDKTQVIAKLPPDIQIDRSFDRSGLDEELKRVGAEGYFLLEDEINRFINYSREMKGEAYSGLVIGGVRDASVQVVLSDNDMIATMVVTGAYGGKPLNGVGLVQALAQAHVTKGINKLALKKVLMVSATLKPGEDFSQAVAQGKPPIQGKDVQFVPLVEDVSKQVLAPKQDEQNDKIDMLNLGETITVDENQPLMRRKPATKGEPGVTVQGKLIPPKPGKDQALSASKGSHISPTDPNLLLASVSGMPIIRNKTVEVENALCLANIGVATGHVKFKGNVIVNGDIESDMVVRATGSVTVGGFIESADVQAKGDIIVAKGIIGHTDTDGERKSCVVKSGANIKANYAQYAELQAAEDIELVVHSLSNHLRCGGNLTVSDKTGKQGTLSGGTSQVGGKISCINLGVEGDTATYVEAFARFNAYKDKIARYREMYRQVQEETMTLVRKELELKKRPKAERSDEEIQQMEQMKEAANAKLEKTKTAIDVLEDEFNRALEENFIEVKSKVYTHVTVQYGEEKVITKRTHGASRFSFNQYEIKCSSLFDEDAIEEGI